MANKIERMEELRNKGIDTNKYFQIDLPKGLVPGSKIQIVINDSGEPVIAESKDMNIPKDILEFRNQIISDGYLRNSVLHRRFIMAQMFRMLNWKRTENSNESTSDGFHGYLNTFYSYNYTLTMMTEEIRVISHIQSLDDEAYNIRSCFFNVDVVIDVLYDYLEKLKKYVETLPVKKCKDVPYKKIKGINIFVEDIEKKIYNPIFNLIKNIEYKRNVQNCFMDVSYLDIYCSLNKFMKKYFVKLPFETPKSKKWIDAYKGAGAYYTLKNMILYHDCFVVVDDKNKLFGMKAMEYLDEKIMCWVDCKDPQWWRFFAFMKKTIKDNNFDFKERMDEIYSKKNNDDNFDDPFFFD